MSGERKRRTESFPRRSALVKKGKVLPESCLEAPEVVSLGVYNETGASACQERDVRGAVTVGPIPRISQPRVYKHPDLVSTEAMVQCNPPRKTWTKGRTDDDKVAQPDCETDALSQSSDGTCGDNHPSTIGLVSAKRSEGGGADEVVGRGKLAGHMFVHELLEFRQSEANSPQPDEKRKSMNSGAGRGEKQHKSRTKKESK